MAGEPPLTLLGRITASNGSADPDDAARLAAWSEQGNGSRQSFDAFLAERVRQWLGEAADDAKVPALLRHLATHRREARILVEDGLRRAADEGATF